MDPINFLSEKYPLASLFFLYKVAKSQSSIEEFRDKSNLLE